MQKQTIKSLRKQINLKKLAIQGILKQQDRILYYGYVDLNEIQENSIIHFACPVKYFIIIEFDEGYSILTFSSEKGMINKLTNLEESANE
jgi:hypothetical protein